MRGSRILVLIETVDRERNLRFPNTKTVGHATAQALPRQPIKMQGSTEFVPLGGKCFHGVYIPAAYLSTDQAPDCSLCRPFEIIAKEGADYKA